MGPDSYENPDPLLLLELTGMIEKMKILMFSTIFPPQIGGPATQCFNLCLALVSKGHQPVVVTYGDKFTKTAQNGFPVYTYRSKYVWGPIDRVIRWALFPFYISYLLKKEKIQILHCHSVNLLSFIAVFIAWLHGVPRVIKFAGDWVWETISTKGVVAEDYREIYTQSLYSRLLTQIEKVGLSFFNIIWVVSEFRRENIKYLLGDDRKVRVINNCLLLKDGGSHTKTPADGVVIVSANRFIPHKRLPWLVEVYAKIVGANNKLVLIGGGDEAEIGKVKEAIKKYQLEDKVILKGILSFPDLYNEFKQATFYVSSSLEEGFPNVFIEALNFGLPIISTDVGGCRELVKNGETGFLVPVDDLEQMSEKMKLLTTDVELRNKLSRQAFESSKKFNLEFMVDEFINLYEGLLKV